ncbi:sulfatase [Acidobacteriota bacterium]
MKTMERRTIPKRALWLSVTFLILLASSCAKKEEIPVYRFIDHLAKENILRSPLQELAADPEKFKTNNPGLFDIADESPLMDYGAGENPFLIKKKLKIGPAEINTILSPPQSHFRFSLKIPENSYLEFTYGIRRDSEMENSGKGQRTVQFSVVIEKEKTKTELFSNTLSLKADKSLAFNSKRVDLKEYEGENVQIYLSTKGTKKALACWFNPVIFSPQERQKSVILISLDTLRADHLGCYGYSRDTSPGIDKLAEDSAVFLNTFATSPWTLPSHVSLLTALNCINHQVYNSDEKMDPSIKTLADFLRSKGYFNSAITGGGYVSGIFGLNKGFDSYHVRGQLNDSDSAEKATQGVLDFIERNKDRNFFFFLHSYQIHSPYFPPPPYDEMFLAEDAEWKKVNLGELRLNHQHRFKPLSDKQRQNIIDLYDGEIRYTDEKLISPIINKLKSLNLYDDTMIILTADHGEEFFEHKSWAHSHSVYDETIKVPMIVKSFNSEHAGRRIEKYARLVDAMPTILEALGIDHSDNYMDGESLYSLLLDNSESTEERIFLSELAPYAGENHIPRKIAINQGRNKLIINDKFSPEDLAYYTFPPPEIQKMEIYDLTKDPREILNLIKKEPSMARRLIDFMNARYKQNKKVKTNKAKIDEELNEQLRALGYIE